MNFWGFTTELFPALKADFDNFLNTADLQKDEFYLPFAVEDIMKSGEASVKVYNTDAIWYGVTYKEDKPAVVAGIREMIANGIYPAGLWK